MLAGGAVVAALAVANAFGDVVGEDGELIGAPHDDSGRLVRTADLLPGIAMPPLGRSGPGAGSGPASDAATPNTTLVCVFTDADLDKRSCAIVARMASAGIARAVNPVFTPVDGDVVFCPGVGVRAAAVARPRGHVGADGARNRGGDGHGETLLSVACGSFSPPEVI